MFVHNKDRSVSSLGRLEGGYAAMRKRSSIGSHLGGTEARQIHIEVRRI